MFSKELLDKLSSFNTALTLTRDLTLSVVVLLTIVILYFGGDPSSLNALDWAKLVVSAFLVVIGPIVAFYIFKIFFQMLHRIAQLPTGLLDPDAAIPKGTYAWLCINILRKSKRQYIHIARRQQKEAAHIKERYPRIYKGIIKLFGWYEEFYAFQNKTNPYFMGMLVLIIAGIVFTDVFNKYIP